MPYTKFIDNNSVDAHNTSPGYVLSFVRWKNRDTINYDLPDLEVRNPLVVINDAISIQTGDSKSSVTGSLNVVLKAGDINYATAIAPGDYVFVNLLEDEFTAADVAKVAAAGRQINKAEYGFKGLYKVQKVRRQLVTDPNSGAKTYQFVLHAFSFSELNTVIYYNPTAARAFRESRDLFLSQFADWWNTISTNRNNQANVQDILVKLVKALLGNGLRNRSGDLAADATANDQFIFPSLVARMMGVNTSKATVPDVYNFVFGVWKNKNNSSNNTSLGAGFNPGISRIAGNNTFYKTKGERLQGWRLLAAEDFNYKTIWSIIKAYMNAGINEAYTCMRINPENNGVYPTLIIRQKPFNSDHFEKPNTVNGKKSGNTFQIPHTKYSSLPRWRVTPDRIYSMDLGKDEVARVNYVQFYGRSLSVNPGYNESLQAQNIYYDKEDIKRHGLKPSIITTNCDFPLNVSNTSSDAKRWAWLMFDMLNAGQNRESGSLTLYGVKEPICVGDNLEFDGNIYHIESVSHAMQVSPTGRKQFRTTLALSFGTNLSSNSNRPVYPQQENTFTEVERKKDWDSGQKILPGLSDTQHLPTAEGRSRTLGDLQQTTKERGEKQASFTGSAVNETGSSRASTVNTKFDNKKKE